MPFYNELNNHSNFVISFSSAPKQEFCIFARGYSKAASLLSADLLSRHFSDFEAYPVVFLYRHALELYLKSFIYNSSLIQLLTDVPDLERRLQNTHSLTMLSEIAATILLNLFPRDIGLMNLLKLVKETCAEFEQIDRDSYSYRYPIDRKGNPSTQHHQSINLQSFDTHMAALMEELDTVSFGLNIETDNAATAYAIRKQL